MATEVRSYCRICAAACGIVVTVDGDRIDRVRGDAEHPVSRGYVCSKGRALPAWHHDARRLDRPRVRGADVPWDVALDDLGAILRGIVQDRGPDAIALYLATGLAYDAGGQIAAGMWMGALGSSAFYTAATVDNAPILVAAELVSGQPMLNPVWDPGSPGLLVLVGLNPVVSHGYGTTLPDPVRHLRDYRRSGGRVWVLDPRRTETAALADEHLSVRPGSDVAVLGAIARALVERCVIVDGRVEVLAGTAEPCAPADIEALRLALAPFTAERAAAAAGVDAEVIERLIADVLDHPQRLAMFCGTGTTMSRDGVLVEWLRWVILILSGSLDRPGGMRFNRGAVNRLRPPRPGRPDRPPLPGPASRPELRRVAGQVPAVALVDEIEAGNVRALVVTGGNPLAAFPEPDRVRAALRRLDALVVIDVLHNDLCDLATHVLPATGQLERADLSLAEQVAIRSGLQATRAVVGPVAERRPVWWILGSLARRLDRDLLGGAAPDDLTDERFLRGILAHSALDPDTVFANGPHGTDVPVEHGWVRDTMLPDGRWQIAPPILLERLAAHTDLPADGLLVTPRRQMAWSNTVRYGPDESVANVRIHPDDAAAHGLADGDVATVSSAHGTVPAAVRVDAGVRPGVVSMTHGRRGASPGRLTSGSVDVDPLTAMPLASGLPVALSPSPVRESAPTPAGDR
jgi:anaerobic selenocysteine-containing dehydrogenase